jgi:hypothetical protein
MRARSVGDVPDGGGKVDLQQLASDPHDDIRVDKVPGYRRRG